MNAARVRLSGHPLSARVRIGWKPMASLFDLSPAELDALRDLQKGVSERDADDPVWDALEQYCLVESREKGSDRLLTPIGRDYPTD